MTHAHEPSSVDVGTKATRALMPPRLRRYDGSRPPERGGDGAGRGSTRAIGPELVCWVRGLRTLPVVPVPGEDA
ncbi:hypothetical protein ABT215_22730 [Streptomyces sp900105755]|uniref:hypothetical protein n=1 Tax=Streptomyces sp. 900105755 TaxID=3154389 RepID=UPI0033191A94